MTQAEYQAAESKRKALEAEFNDHDRHITQPIDDGEPIRLQEVPGVPFIEVDDDNRYATK
jgi:hypothetical protein